jgi:hypothetical protein
MIEEGAPVRDVAPHSSSEALASGSPSSASSGTSSSAPPSAWSSPGTPPSVNAQTERRKTRDPRAARRPGHRERSAGGGLTRFTLRDAALDTELVAFGVGQHDPTGAVRPAVVAHQPGAEFEQPGNLLVAGAVRRQEVQMDAQSKVMLRGRAVIRALPCGNGLAHAAAAGGPRSPTWVAVCHHLRTENRPQRRHGASRLGRRRGREAGRVWSALLTSWLRDAGHG